MAESVDIPPEVEETSYAAGRYVGAMLRAARLQHGLELSEIAGSLRIRASFLEGIEQGRLQALPGVAYAIGFVRAYAEFLGLDGAEMVQRFKAEVAGLDRKPNLSFPSPAPEGKVPGTGAIVLSLVAAVLLFGGGYVFKGDIARLAIRVPEIPERLAGLLPGAPSSSAEASAPTGAPTRAQAAAPGKDAGAPEPEIAPAPPGMLPASLPAAAPVPAVSPPAAAPVAAVASPLVPPSLVPSSPVPSPVPPSPAPVVAAAEPVAPAAAPAPVMVPPPAAAGTAPAAPKPALGLPGTAPAPIAAEPAIPAPPQIAAVPSDTRVFGSTNADSRVVLRAKGDSWVQIRDSDNQPVLSRLLRAGDVYKVPNKPGLTMVTGNAGMLEITVDGVSLPPLGDVGVVRKNVSLDPDRLHPVLN